MKRPLGLCSQSLGLKFVMLVVVILSITTGLSAYYIIHKQTDLILDHLKGKGEMMGKFVSLIAPEPILGYDFKALDRYMQELSRHSDFVYGVVLATDGQPMTSFLDRKDAYLSKIPEIDTLKVIQAADAHRDIIPMRLPIEFEGEKIGTVAVGLTRARAEALSRETMIKQGAINAFIILVLSASIYFVFRHYALRPIQHLGEGFARAAKGELTQEVPVSSQDELGKLTHSFNRMMHDLKQSIGEKDEVMRQIVELNKNLEQRVKDRTRDLERSEQRIRAILDSVGEGIVVIDEKGFVESINPAGLKILHWSETEAIGLHNLMFVSDKFIDNIKSRVGEKELPKQFESGHFETQGLRSDGSLFPMELTVTRTQLGDQDRRICILRDITERKEAELKLADAQKQLLDAAHKSGMADMATGVLHNIGNVLNSVNISGETIDRTLKGSKLSGLLKANELLRAHQAHVGEFLTNDAKGKMLPNYLLTVGDVLTGEKETLLKETHTLMEKVNLMKDIIRTQQSYAKSGFYQEDAALADVVDDALRLQQGSLERHGVRIEKVYSVQPTLALQKTKFIHVLTNLIKNAGEAMADNDLHNKPKLLRLVIEAVGETDVGVRISDNGCGIAKENLNMVFNHGFTTKTEGHGFGLHSCANAMTEMHGSISVSSEGPGLGASFTLTLPNRRAATKPMANAA
jgi:PAS domain S-box-containing protein